MSFDTWVGGILMTPSELEKLKDTPIEWHSLDAPSPGVELPSSGLASYLTEKLDDHLTAFYLSLSPYQEHLYNQALGSVNGLGNPSTVAGALLVDLGQHLAEHGKFWELYSAIKTNWWVIKHWTNPQLLLYLNQVTHQEKIMAVTISAKEGASQLLKALKLDHPGDGWDITIKLKSVEITHAGVTKTVLMPTLISNLMKQGSSHALAPLFVNAYLSAILELKALEWVEPGVMPKTFGNLPDKVTATYTIPTQSKKGDPSVNPEYLGVKVSESPDGKFTATYTIPDKGVFMSAEIAPDVNTSSEVGVVDLRDATELYQPVKGTSAGSVYKVIGIAKNAAGVKFAARIKGNTVSLRAEWDNSINKGPGFTKMITSGAGLQMHEGYASLHVNVNKTSVDRVIGAVLVGSGLEFYTPIPNVAKVL